MSVIIWAVLLHYMNMKWYIPKYMSSSSIFCWLASVARVAIALHNSIKSGGGNGCNKATLNGERINISPDNNIQVIRRPLLAATRKNKKPFTFINMSFWIEIA